MPVCGASDGVESEGDHNLHEEHHPWAGVCVKDQELTVQVLEVDVSQA